MAEKEPKETALEKLENTAKEIKAEFYKDQYGNTVVEIGKRVYDIEDQEYRALLAETYYNNYQDVFNDSTFKKHVSLGISKAVRKNPKTYPRRIHRDNKKLYYDSGTEVWEFQAGIHYTYLADDPECPIIFRRYNDFINAPLEVTEEKPKELINKILNQYNHDGLHWAYIASFFEPNHSHPIGLFNGEPGSAKSTLTSFIKNLVDPSVVFNMSFPEKTSEFDTYREKFYVCNYDNVRKITAEQADELSRQVTGSASVKRKLYTNAGLYMSSGKPRILINGVKPEPSAFNDLLDRLYPVFLRRLTNNKEEDTIKRQLEEQMPKIRFSCMKIISEHLNNLEDTQGDLPRLADFTMLCETISSANDEPPGSFIQHYKEKISMSHAAGLDDTFAAVLIEYLEAHRNANNSYSALEWFQHIKEWACETIQVDDGGVYSKTAFLRPELERVVNDKTFLQNPIAIGRRFRELNNILYNLGYEINYRRTSDKNIIEVKKK